MSDSRVARRYAEALIEVAGAEGAIDAVAADLRGFIELLDAHDGLLRGALCTPVFSADERAAVLGELLPRLGLGPLATNFLRLLSDKGRMAAIDAMVEVYGELADERAGRVRVRITTAEALDEAIAAEVRQALSEATGQTVVLAPDVDPSLIGGMVVRFGGKVYDSSLRTRLHDVRRALLRAQAPAQAK